MDKLLEWWPVLSPIFSGLALWAIWSVRSGLVGRKEWQESNRRVGERLGAVEVRVAGLPSRDDVAQLIAQMSKLDGDVREMSGKLEVVADQVKMLFEHQLGR